ncbi:MAG: DUF3298 domain-containing protein [Clostridium sp.]|nr:DUF3298 domain-containing protein [Clostridium sp.]
MKNVLCFIVTYFLTITALPSASPMFTTLSFQTEKVLPSKIIAITYVTHTLQNNTEVFHGYYTYPKFTETFSSASTLNQYYFQQFIQDYQEMKEIRDTASLNILPPKTSYAYDHTFEITTISEKMISIIENITTYAGGIQPTSFRKSNTFHLESGKKVSLEDLLSPVSHDVDNLVRSYLIAEINKSPNDYYPDATQIVQKKSLNTFLFYLTPTEFVIYFNPGEIAPYLKGVVEFR